MLLLVFLAASPPKTREKNFLGACGPQTPAGRLHRQNFSFFPLHMPIWVYNNDMARAATTEDAFNAVAEPRRRQILDALVAGERSVNELVAELDLAQPQVSKHLRVLREVGLVSVRDNGRQRMYQLRSEALRPIHDWLKTYEHIWNERFDALDELLAELKGNEEHNDSSSV